MPDDAEPRAAGPAVHPGLISQPVLADASILPAGPAEIPADDDIARLGRALAAGRHGERLASRIKAAQAPHGHRLDHDRAR